MKRGQGKLVHSWGQAGNIQVDRQLLALADAESFWTEGRLVITPHGKNGGAQVRP